MMDNAFFILRSSDVFKVLMVQESQSCNLPLSTGIHDACDIDECCVALQNALDLTQQNDETVFTTAASRLSKKGLLP